MHTDISVADFRNWASQCNAQATNPRTSGDERDHLMKMRQALLALADNQEWFDGNPNEKH